ncbi:MAG: peptidoglycan-binding domain-containing protein [Candidatus Omnitrophica bacterium]|nr:peptidoglycan-binding domain-containing protein [Candidatus Omnitrophota bacterium]
MKRSIFLVIVLVVLLGGCAVNKKVVNSESMASVAPESVNQESIVATQPEGSVAQVAQATPDVNQKPLSKKQIQLALKKAGFYKGHVDGHIGKGTRRAIREFQKANGLKADGIVGPKTQSLLGKYIS